MAMHQRYDRSLAALPAASTAQTVITPLLDIIFDKDISR